MKIIQSTAIFTFVGLWFLIAYGYTAEVDHGLYASLLNRPVHQTGWPGLVAKLIKQSGEWENKGTVA